MLSTRSSSLRNVPDWSGARSRVSAGITAATTGQVTVVCKAMLDPAVHRRLSAQPDQRDRLPIGTEECHHVVPGELVFTLAAPYHSYTPSVPGDITLTVFTAFNGRSPRDPWVFRGVAATPATLGQGRKTDLTYKASGTDTIINTGPEVIPEGTLVYARFPSAREGVPNEASHQQYGKPRNKFVAELRPLHAEHLFQRWLEFEQRMREVLSEKSLPGALPSMKPFNCEPSKEILEAVDRAAREFRVDFDDARDPFMRAARLFVCALYKDVPGTGLNTDGRQEVLLHTEALMRAAEGPSHRRMAHRGLHDEKVTICGGNHIQFFAPLVGIFFDYMNFMNSRIVGKALSTAQPGDQFEILIGAHNCS